MARLNLGIKQHHPNWVIIAIILLAALIRLPILSIQSIAFDESFSLVVGLADWPTLFGAILSDGVHPPLFYVIHKLALALWGTSEFGQRFLAAAFSLVSVPLVYWSGGVLFNRNVGLLGALLLALNPLHVWLAQEARMYSLLGALVIISLTVFWQAVHTGRLRYWVILTFVDGVIFYLHYFGFLIPMIQFVFILATFRYHYHSLRPWAVVQIIAFLPLIPWLLATATREAQTFGIGFLVRPNVPDLFVTLWNLTLGSRDLYWFTTVAVGVVGLALLTAVRPLAPHQVQPKQARLLVLLWGLLPVLLTWLISQRRSFYADRYLSFAIPGILLLLAFGATRLQQKHWRYLLVVGLIFASGYGLLAVRFDPAFQKDDWRAVAAYMNHNEQPNEIILLYTTHIKYVFDYYYRGHASTTPISLNLDQFPLEPLTTGHRRVWVVYPYTRRPTHYPMQPLLPDGFWHNDPERNPYLVNWLEAHTDDIIDYQHFRGVELWLVDQGEAAE